MIDECNICGGTGKPDLDCDCLGNTLDCNGVCGGYGEMDNCEVCDGPGMKEGACDCSGQVEDCF